MVPKPPAFAGLVCAVVFLGAAHAASAPDGAQEGAACSAALRQVFPAQDQAAALPAPCRRLGPVALGMRQQDVLAALGKPDATRHGACRHETTIAYLYPRGLNERLASHPLPPGSLDHGELAIRFRDGRVVNIIAFGPHGELPGFGLPGLALGADVGTVLQAVGGHPQWNASRDYVQFAAMPLGLEVDPDTSAVVGIDIAATKQDLEHFSLPPLRLHKDGRSGLVSGIH
ncbi:secreted signal peptide protein [Paracidovorax avenae]|nr:secreted signal peptide protein [Paracidovorax avenae]AVT02402.1 secreted signal peptide protein [Paracidovorax avenae]